jgi:hypothetical protein
MSEPAFILHPTTVLARKDNMLGTSVDSDLVMMDEERAKFFGLNSVAKAIWNHLASPTSYAALLDFLTINYKVTREKCAQDIEPFLAIMIEQQLIFTSDPRT